MALAFTRNLCRLNTLNRLNLAKAVGPQWCNTRNINLRVVSKPTPKVESHDEKNDRIGRPLSPHLTIYKFQLTSILSISHRFAGVALTGWAVILGYGSLVMPHDAAYYISALESLSAPSLFALKYILTFPLAYHTANGIRHFCWDAGKFLTMPEVYKTGYIMLGASIISTAILCCL
uniref:CSON010823 protein n=1 Tax=Culicoides sonorensis TaxID=179676 RepID=A0A336M2H0_CULSO